MLELLTGALARRNPSAYAAHFRRLGPADQRAYLDQLAGEDLPDHARALGLRSTIGFTLTLEPRVVLEPSVAGKRLPAAAGWPAVVASEVGARALGATVGPPAVTGLLVTGIGALVEHGPRLRESGWPVAEITLTEDLHAGGQAEWAVAGELARGGRFWSSRQLLPTDELPRLTERLEEAARSCGARFHRVGHT